jgi:hypothetical protein
MHTVKQIACLVILGVPFAFVGCASQSLTRASTETFATSHGLQRVTIDGQEKFCRQLVPTERTGTRIEMRDGSPLPAVPLFDDCVSWSQLRLAQLMSVAPAPGILQH